MSGFGWRATGRLVSVPPAAGVPEGTVLDLPGRGSTYVVDTGAPDGSVEPAPRRPTLLLLHALACTGLLTWYPAIQELRRSYRVVTFDQRWHGQGIRSPQFALEDCADDAVAVADALGLDDVVLVGYSMGSLVAQLACYRHPARFGGLVLCATTSRFTGTREPAALRVISERISRTAEWRLRAARSAAAVTVSAAEHNRWAIAQLRTTRGAGIAGAAAVISRFDSCAWIGSLDLPTAVVVTASDRLIPPARQHWVARQIPGATVYEVAAGHAACVLRATEFTPALQAATASVSARVAARALR
jgi:pimeloyl-ACP methyl ester carboxylesterase